MQKVKKHAVQDKCVPIKGRKKVLLTRWEQATGKEYSKELNGGCLLYLPLLNLTLDLGSSVTILLVFSQKLKTALFDLLQMQGYGK